MEGVDHMTIWRILSSYQLYPYHPQRVQALSTTDSAPRVAFWGNEKMTLIFRVLFYSPMRQFSPEME